MSRKFSDAELKGEKYLKDKAESGDAEAKYSLGHFYFSFSHSLRNVELLNEAERWFKDAAKDGNKEAIERLEKYWDEEKPRIKGLILEAIEDDKIAA